MTTMPDQWTAPFAGLTRQPPDVLLSLIKAHREDPRPEKLDLGVGVYRDAHGRTPVFSAVKAAEAQLLSDQATKSYLGPEGDLDFLERLEPVVFGAALRGKSAFGVQTPGGTGALRLAAELIHAGRPGARVWMGVPSWPIHSQIFAAAGLRVEPYRHLDLTTRGLAFDDLLDALDRAEAGDVVLLHGCCHNPSGADLDPAQWSEVAMRLAARGLVPLLDLAYQGLGGGLEADAQGVREVFDAADDALVAYSCDKNFGLYRERTGALFTKSRRHLEATRSSVLALARCLWSMPPDHGAAIVGIILQTPALAAQWRSELDGMRHRLNGIRTALADADPTMEFLRRQRGLFALLPLAPADVDALRREAAIYIAGSGRINLAGLNAETLPGFVRALTASLEIVAR